MGRLFLLLIVSWASLSGTAWSQAPESSGDTPPLFNAHEHVESPDLIEAYLEAVEPLGVAKTVLLGSPEATFHPGKGGFTGEEENNQALFEIARRYPGKFLVFPTVNVQDPEKLEKVKRYLQQGARGLKLYSGHAYFHGLPLDDPSALPLYAFCEQRQIPILIHVNPGYYQKEFESVLKQYPKLRVICPHFCLSTIRSERFEYLMKTYPQLYTDISFGFVSYLKAALDRFSREPEKYRDLIRRYRDRIFFGMDLVVSRASYKTVNWYRNVAQAYRDFLEKDTYTFFLTEDRELNGLGLDRKTLKKIYQQNFEHFFSTN